MSPTEPAPAPTAPTRRSVTRAARSRFDVTTLVAFLVPVLAVLAALLVDTGVAPRASVGPDETPLTRSSVICPAGGSAVLVASTSGASGDVDVRAGATERTVPVAPGTSSEVRLGERATVLTGEGDLAPGLVAARFSEPLASFDCRPPVFDQWFTGVGAGARHRSSLQLVNPDEGRAVVDVVVLGRDGVVDAPFLRGIAVRGGESRTIDLATRLPRRDELALHVTVGRGRIAASIRDAYRGIGDGRRGDDGLGSQDEPADSNLMLGIPGGSGPRTLVIANPQPTQGRAGIKLVTADSVFAPSGLEDVELPPESVVRVRLTDVLRDSGAGEDRAVGLLVESSVPTTASLSMFVAGDLAVAVPVTPLVGAGTAVLPPGVKRLVLGEATGRGVATISSWDAVGTPLPDQRVEIAAGRAVPLRLADEARLITVTPARTSVSAVVLVTADNGATLVRVREPVTTGLVSSVSPGLP